METFGYDGIRGALEGCGWADRVRFFQTVDSTNNLAKELARDGAPEGTVLVADCQTGGRGSRGRSFLSPGGMGIYLSVILRPDCFPEDCMHLTCGAAVAVCRALERYGFHPGIKWTNDIVIERRKVCGILTEIAVNPETGRLSHAVVGIGINCRQRGEDFPPTLRSFAGSLQMFSGAQVDRNGIAAALIRELERLRASLHTRKGELLEAYRARCVTIGQEVSVVRGDRVFHARALAVDDDGGLLVEREDGSRETVASGEVSVRGMYGYS